jgi:hypothetical protein
MRKPLVLTSVKLDRILSVNRSVPSPPVVPDEPQHPANRGGFTVFASKTEAFAWETQEVEFNPDASIAIRSVINDDPAITALWSGDPELPGDDHLLLTANRPDQPDNEAGPAERWFPELVNADEGTWALRNAHNGKYLEVDPETGKLYARGDSVTDNALFRSSVPLLRHAGPVDNGFDGQIRVDPRGGFMRNEEPVLVVSCHHGDGFGHAQRNWDHEMNRLDVIVAAGYDMSREWPTAGGNFWAGKDHDERGVHRPHWPGDNVDRRMGPVFTPDFRNNLIRYYEQKKTRGLYTHIANGAFDAETVPDWPELAHTFRDVIGTIGHEYFGVMEVINEARDTMGDRGIGEAYEFARIAYAPFPHAVIGISAYTGADFEATEVSPARLRQWSRSPANVIMHHGYRGGGYPNKLERDWNLSYDWDLDKQIVDGEPVGTQERTSATDNMHELNGAFFTLRGGLMLGTGRICTHMSGAGVITDEGKGTLEESAGFYELPKVKQLLPKNCGHYRRVFHGGERWASDRLFAATEHTRVEHMLHDETGEFLVIAYGPDSFTREPVRRLQVEADHRIEQDHIRGRIIYGRV